MTQVIIDFVGGTAEDAARATVARHGGAVRRRMRSDDPARVRLLVTIDDDAGLAREPSVERLERDEPNFGVR